MDEMQNKAFAQPAWLQLAPGAAAGLSQSWQKWHRKMPCGTIREWHLQSSSNQIDREKEDVFLVVHSFYNLAKLPVECV